MKIIKKYKWTLFWGAIVLGLLLFNNQVGTHALDITFSNFEQMLMLLPPILVLMGLLDVWVPKETLVKYMGKGSGMKGLAISFVLGTAAAGPLYLAFPLGTLLLRKGASLTNVIFLLGVWSSTKLPIILFEIASMGLKFTIIHVGISLPSYLLVAYIIDKLISSETLTFMVEKAEAS